MNGQGLAPAQTLKSRLKQHAAIFVLAPSRYVDNHIKLFYLYWFALLPYLFYLLEFLINFILCKILIKSLFFFLEAFIIQITSLHGAVFSCGRITVKILITMLFYRKFKSLLSPSLVQSNCLQQKLIEMCATFLNLLHGLIFSPFSATLMGLIPVVWCRAVAGWWGTVSVFL